MIYSAYIKTCFDKAYDTQIVRQRDAAKLKPHKKINKAKPAEVARITGRSASTIGKYIRMAGMTKAHRHAVEQTIGKK